MTGVQTCALPISRVHTARPELIPWAIGVNGAASVIASIVAIVIAMELGFKVDSLLAIACYVVACASVPAGAPAQEARP